MAYSCWELEAAATTAAAAAEAEFALPPEVEALEAEKLLYPALP